MNKRVQAPVTARRKVNVQREKPVSPAKAQVAKPEVIETPNITWQVVVGAAVLAAGAWAYWPTLVEMVSAWEREPDYSHGYLVAPMAIFFLWLNRASFPGVGPAAWVLGLTLIGLSIAARLAAGAFFVSAVDGWSLVIWVAGSVALLFGARVTLWAWPSIAFLIFMVPLPFRFESMLSLPLQRLATKISCWGLQLLGQPAIAEGNTILLGEQHLEVEQACSGLRLFVSILALACAYLIVVKRPWWEKAFLVLSVAPIAILANSLRIMATGLLYEFVSSDWARHFSHDFAGWAMIPVAALMFWAVLWYLRQLFREQEQLQIASLVSKAEI